MIDALEAEGRIKPGVTTLIEPTSGNTGIALAFVAAARGYRLILVMPETMSVERRKMLKLLGAELVLTEGARGMRGAIARADELTQGDRRMRSSRSNSRTRPTRRSTGAPRPRKSGTTPTARSTSFVSGVGTGGTITGVGQVLKPRKPSLRIIAVEPEDSPVLSGGKPGPHKIQGIGAGFVPPILDTERLSTRWSRSRTTTPSTYARLCARVEGIPVGISSGAAIAAAVKVGARAGDERARQSSSSSPPSPSATCRPRCSRDWNRPEGEAALPPPRLRARCSATASSVRGGLARAWR